MEKSLTQGPWKQSDLPTGELSMRHQNECTRTPAACQPAARRGLLRGCCEGGPHSARVRACPLADGGRLVLRARRGRRAIAGRGRRIAARGARRAARDLGEV